MTDETFAPEVDETPVEVETPAPEVNETPAPEGKAARKRAKSGEGEAGEVTPVGDRPADRLVIRIGGRIVFANDVYDPVLAVGGEGGALLLTATLAPPAISP